MEVLAAECDIIGNPALPPDSGDSYSMGADQFNGAPQK
jgi:replication factor A1